MLRCGQHFQEHRYANICNRKLPHFGGFCGQKNLLNFWHLRNTFILFMAWGCWSMKRVICIGEVGWALYTVVFSHKNDAEDAEVGHISVLTAIVCLRHEFGSLVLLVQKQNWSSRLPSSRWAWSPWTYFFLYSSHYNQKTLGRFFKCF